MHFLTNLDLNRNELQNAVIQPLAVPPADPSPGQIYFDTVDGRLKQWNGSAWVSGGGSNGGGAVDSVNGRTGAVTLSKSDVGLGSADNTSDAAKKSAFTGAIAGGDTGFVTGDAVSGALAGKLSLAGGTMSGPIAMGSCRITGLGAPAADADAATKKYADDLIAGLGTCLDFKGTVASASALPLTGNKKGDVYIVTADNSEYVWISASASGSLSDYEKLGTTADLSGYLEKAGGTMTGALAMGSHRITGLANGASANDAVNYGQLTGLIKTAAGTIAASGTSAAVSYSGTLISAYAVMGGVMVSLDVTVTAGTVTFTTAEPPGAAVTCTVVYA